MSTVLTAQRQSSFAALKDTNYRVYFLGQLASTSGTWVQNIAQGYLVFQLTGSEAMLGLVAFAGGLPVLLFGPIAGVIVDRVPRKNLMLFTQTIQMLQAFTLFLLAYSGHIQVWHVMGLAAIFGMTNALDAPARLSLIVEIVGRDYLQSGIAMTSLLNSGSRVLGPALAGLALAQFGATWCFLINALSFTAVIGSLLMIEAPYAVKAANTQRPWQQLKAGLSYVWHDALVFPLMLMVGKLGFLAIPMISQFPAFAERVLHSPEDGLSALSVGQGIGSVLAGVATGYLAYRYGRGRVIVSMAILTALATMLLSQQVTLIGAGFVSGLTGLFTVLQALNLNTQVQAMIPNEVRGRVMSLYTMLFFGVAPFGSLTLGYMAQSIGTANAVLLYGVVDLVISLTIILRWRSIASLGQDETATP